MKVLVTAHKLLRDCLNRPLSSSKPALLLSLLVPPWHVLPALLCSEAELPCPHFSGTTHTPQMSSPASTEVTVEKPGTHPMTLGAQGQVILKSCMQTGASSVSYGWLR